MTIYRADGLQRNETYFKLKLKDCKIGTLATLSNTFVQVQISYGPADQF